MIHALSSAAARAFPGGSPTEIPAHLRPEFRLLKLAGRCAYAEIWQVQHRQTGRLLAVKQARVDCANPLAARRLLCNEALVLEQARGNHLVALREANLAAPTPYLVQEWLQGHLLAGRLALPEGLHPREALWIARQCAQALRDLLRAGYLHAGLKAESVFIERSGNVKLIDLGFAHLDQRSGASLDGRDAAHGRDPQRAAEPGCHEAGRVPVELRGLGRLIEQLLPGPLPRTHMGSGPAQHESRSLERFVMRLQWSIGRQGTPGLSGLIHELVRLELELAA